MRSAVILPAATVVGGCKNTQIYIIKRAKKMYIGKCNSQDLVLGKEHTASNQQIKKFKTFKLYDKDIKKAIKIS
jgi:hypothetical protein